MPLFRRKPAGRPPEANPEALALKEEVARLREEVDLLKGQNARLAREASPALKENAVLRYELFKCQQDRQVLEFHLSGLRAELRGTLSLLQRYAPGEPPKGGPLLAALLDLLEVGRRLGLKVEAFHEAEEVARAAVGERAFDPERFLTLRLSGLLAALERLLDEELRRAERPGEGLQAYPEALERVREALARALEQEGPREGEGEKA